MNTVYLLGLGLVAGVAAGMFGIGGGLIIVPFLMLVMKMEAVDSFGTSLAAIIPPVGLLGALEYYRNGHVNVRYALLIAAGMILGAFFGAKIMLGISPLTAKRAYGVFLLLVSVRYLFFK
jgi:uncharacterized membrane protein YfcA